MNVQLKPGKYVLAVSGGVDSVVLLSLLKHKSIVSKDSPWKLTVAHFDHGIRADSGKDRLFVEKLAKEYQLAFYCEEGNLGINSSEAKARAARYRFLRKIKQQTKSDAIVTAHHQDDLIETAIINLLRGTKAKGLGSLKSTDEIIRPLLGFSKQQLIDYAKKQKLQWREDATNQDQKYLRNYVRHNLTAKVTDKQRKQLLEIINSSQITTAETADIIKKLLPKNNQYKRVDFVNLPHSVACELTAVWLKSEQLAVDQKTIERLVVGLKSAKNGGKLDINKNCQFLVGKGIIKLQKLK